MESSGNTATSAPREAASRATQTMRAPLPARSPTTGLICARAMRMGTLHCTRLPQAEACATYRQVAQTLVCVQLQRRRIVAEQRAADDLDGRESLLHKCVVELLQRKIRALHGLIVGAKLQDLEFAQRVIQIGRIRRAAL